MMHKVGKVELHAVADTQKGGLKAQRDSGIPDELHQNYFNTVSFFNKDLKYLQKQIHFWCHKNRMM